MPAWRWAGLKAAELPGILDSLVDAFMPPRRSLFERDA